MLKREGRSDKERTRNSRATNPPSDEVRTQGVIESAMACFVDGVIIVDSAGDFIFFNEAAKRMIGLGPLDIRPTEWSSMYGCYLPDKVTPYPAEQLPLAQAMRGESVTDAEVFVRNERTPGGVWLSVNATPLCDGAGGYAGAAVVFRDITALRNSESMTRRFAKAVERTTDAVFITDRAGRIEYVNPAFELVTGYLSDEVLGQRPSILKSGVHDRCYYENLWSELLAGNVYNGSLVNRKKDGLHFHAEQTITPIADTSGRIAHFVSVMRDTTLIRRAEQHETEMALARTVQEKLYPTEPPWINGFDLAGAAFSAAATCGDYFDFIDLANGRVGLALGDVTGHGLGSSLLMAETRAYLRSLAKATPNVDEILKPLNELLYTDTSAERFVTLILASLDPIRRSFVYASAGHIPCYVLDSGGNVKAVLESTGIPLGVFEAAEFGRSAEIGLCPGDLILFWTDGVTESEADEGNYFGEERALRFAASQRESSAQVILDGLHQAIADFTGHREQADDITAIVCKVLPAA